MFTSETANYPHFVMPVPEHDPDAPPLEPEDLGDLGPIFIIGAAFIVGMMIVGAITLAVIGPLGTYQSTAKVCSKSVSPSGQHQIVTSDGTFDAEDLDGNPYDSTEVGKTYVFTFKNRSVGVDYSVDEVTRIANDAVLAPDNQQSTFSCT